MSTSPGQANGARYFTDKRFIGGVILAIVGAVSYVVLIYIGEPGDPNGVERARGVLLFLSPFILPLIAAPAVQSIVEATQANARASQQVLQQTNGQLTKHIDDTATAAAYRGVELYKAEQTQAAPTPSPDQAFLPDTQGKENDHG